MSMKEIERSGFLKGMDVKLETPYLHEFNDLLCKTNNIASQNNMTYLNNAKNERVNMYLKSIISSTTYCINLIINQYQYDPIETVRTSLFLVRNIIEAYADLINLVEYRTLYLPLLNSNDNIKSFEFARKYIENNDDILSRSSISNFRKIFCEHFKQLIPKFKNYPDSKININIPRWSLPKTQNMLRKYQFFYAKSSAASHNNIIFLNDIIKCHGQELQNIHEALSYLINNDLDDIIKKTWTMV